MKRLRYSLPGECLFNIRTRNGERAVFGTLCLKETTSFVNRLPSDCQDRIRVRYGRRADVYDAKCLRERGYQVARYAR